MTPVVGAALLYLACVSFYDADRPMARGLVARLGPRWGVAVARGLACVLTSGAFMIFRSRESGPAPYFLIIVGLTSLGTSVAVLGALWPRALRRLTFAAIIGTIVGGFAWQN